MGGFAAFCRRRVDGGLPRRAVLEAAEAWLRAITRYHPPGGTSADEFLQHMPRLGDFVWELRNHRLEQLLCAPQPAVAWVQRWLTAAEGD